MATRSEDLASKAFREHYAELVEAIQDPDRLALELYANDIILRTTRDEITLTTFTREQKNTKLLAAVESQLHVNPSSFEVFLTVLKERIPLAALCRKIEKAYRRPQIAKAMSGDYAREFSTSSSEAVSLLPEVTPGSASASDREVLVPQDERDTSSSFPYLDMGKLSKRDRLALQSKLLKDSDDIVSEFGDLIHYTINSIVASRISVMKLCTRLSSLGAYRPTRDPVPLLRNQLSEIKRAEDVEEVFSILDDYYSFFNYDIIEKIIGWFGTQEDKERLEAYTDHFKRFCKRRTFECPPNIFGHTIDKGKTNLVVKVEESWDPSDGCSLEIILRLRNSLAEILGVESEMLYLCRIDKGCVELLFQVPSFVEEDIFPLSVEQETSLASIGVTRLTCGSYSYVQPPEPLAPQMSAHAESQVRQKLPTTERMKDWLIRQINSGKFPGLEWLNEEKNVFKVPWIHAKKRGYNKERDAALFRAWAIHSGKYRAESDPIVWKINFRCAINGLKNIQEIKDMQTEDCRVYRIHPSTGQKRARRARRAQFSSTESGYSYNATQHLYTPVCVTDAEFTSQHYTPAIKLEYPEISACAHTSLTGYPTTSIISYIVDPQTSHYVPPLPPISTIISDGSPLSRMDSPDSGISSASSSATSSMSPYKRSKLLDLHSVQSEFELNNSKQEIIQAVEKLEELNSPIPASTEACELQVRVLYGSIPVLNQSINCAHGGRIFFNPYQGQLPQQSGDGGKVRKLFGPPKAEQISLPNCHPNPLAAEIFKAMYRGFVIEMKDSDIYATPLCQTVVYYGQSSTSQSYALEKETCTKVFDYANHFRPSLEHYAINNGQAPNPYCIFSLGQSWGPGKHVAQNLISIVVTHLQAKHELDTIGLPHHSTLQPESGSQHQDSFPVKAIGDSTPPDTCTPLETVETRC